jgi:hypothetical protein
LKGAGSQSANLQEWQNSSGGNLAYMDANGNFYAVSKSFLINHPTKTGRKLRYASLEGPENGIYFRGRLINDNVIELPDYWCDLIDPSSITVHLTPRVLAQPNLHVELCDCERIAVHSDRIINCDFVVYATRRDIPPLEVELNGDEL